jgi:FkbM family methyltransferase
VKKTITKILNKFGYDIHARNFLRSHEIRRGKFLNDHKISLVLDVGANEGQYAQSIRLTGYKNSIISFEPIKEVFQLLNNKINKDLKWKALNIAIGDFDGETEINISDFSQVSSILSATGLAATDYWKANRKQQVQVRQLDSLIDELNIEDHRIFLKVDTQGFEDKVLKGCQKLLTKNVFLIEIELSVRQFYFGEKLFPEMLVYIQNMGFELVSMSPVHVDFIRGYVLQYDCIFIRKSILDLEEK